MPLSVQLSRASYPQWQDMTGAQWQSSRKRCSSGHACLLALMRRAYRSPSHSTESSTALKSAPDVIRVWSKEAICMNGMQAQGLRVFRARAQPALPACQCFAQTQRHALTQMRVEDCRWVFRPGWVPHAIAGGACDATRGECSLCQGCCSFLSVTWAPRMGNQASAGSRQLAAVDVQQRHRPCLPKREGRHVLALRVPGL